MAERQLNVIVSAVDRLSKPAASMTKDLKAIEAAGRAAADTLQTRMMIASTAVVAAFAACAYAAADYGEQLVETSQKTGMAVEELGALKYAAEQSGVGFDQMRMGLTRMQRAAFEAARGSKEQADTFRMLGVAVQDASGGMRSGTEIFRDVAERIAAMDDPTARAALAMRVFGRSGAELLPLLQEGGAGIDELMQRAEKLGLVMSDQAARDAEEFGDAIDDLKLSAKGVAIAIGEAAFGTTEYAKKIAEAVGGVSTWIREHKTAVQVIVGLAGFVTTLTIGMYGLNKAVGMVRETMGLVRAVLDMYKGRVLANTGAVEAETIALDGNTAAQYRNAAAAREAGGARGAGGPGAVPGGGGSKLGKALGYAGAVVPGGYIGWEAAGAAGGAKSTAAQAGYGAAGVFGGAAAGAVAGSIIPGIGTVGGAIAGGGAAAATGTYRMAADANRATAEGRKRAEQVVPRQTLMLQMTPAERRAYISGEGGTEKATAEAKAIEATVLQRGGPELQKQLGEDPMAKLRRERGQGLDLIDQMRKSSGTGGSAAAQIAARDEARAKAAAPAATTAAAAAAAETAPTPTTAVAAMPEAAMDLWRSMEKHLARLADGLVGAPSREGERVPNGMGGVGAVGTRRQVPGAGGPITVQLVMDSRVIAQQVIALERGRAYGYP